MNGHILNSPAMTHHRDREVEYRSWAGFAATLVLALLLALPVAAAPSSPPEPAPVKTEELRLLAATLKDDKARAHLIEQLDGLIDLQRGGGDAAAEEGVLGGLSQAIGSVGDGVVTGLDTLADAPKLFGWASSQALDPAVRLVWGRILLNLLAMLAGGLVAERLARMLLARLRHAMVPAAGLPLLARLPAALGHGVIELVPVAAFAGAGYGIGILLRLSGNLWVAAMMMVTAYAALRMALVAAAILLAPRWPSLRLAPVDDETAEYLMIWLQRLAAIGLFGWFAAEAALPLGLPPHGYRLVVKGLGLMLAVLAVVLVLQNREPVAAAISRAAKRLGERMRGLAQRVAEIWHVLAVLYIAAIYLVWAIPVKGGAEFMLRATVLTVVILVLARALGGLLRGAIDRGFAISQEARNRFPLLEARANRYLPAVHLALRGVVSIVAVLALLQAWGVNTFAWVSSDIGRHILSSAVSIAAVLTAAVVVWELVAGAIERYLSPPPGEAGPVARSARARTLLPLARSALFILMAVMVTLIVLSELGVNIAPLLAGAGVVGIAIGFGSQKLVQDVITGVFILFENTIAVGDVVKLDSSHSGSVEAISIRAIRLRDAKGSVHTIPFSAVGTVINMTREFAYAVFEVAVAYSEDTDRIAVVLGELGADLRADPEFGPMVLDNVEVLGVDRFEASSVIVSARVKTLPLKQWSVSREFNRRIKRRFDQLGIEFPASQTTVWLAREEKAALVPETV